MIYLIVSLPFCLLLSKKVIRTSNLLLKNTRPPTQERCGGRLFTERPQGAATEATEGSA